MNRVPLAIFALSDPDSVHHIHGLTEHFDEPMSYIIIYATPVDDGRVWCQEIFTGNVLSALVETIQSRIILCEPVPVTLLIISATIVDVDLTSHEENVDMWDADAGDDLDDLLNVTG